MSPQELRDVQRRQPFAPFRLVMVDGTTYDVPHPDLMMVGLHSAHIGFVRKPGRTLYERSVKIDLLRIVRLELIR